MGGGRAFCVPLYFHPKKLNVSTFTVKMASLLKYFISATNKHELAALKSQQRTGISKNGTKSFKSVIYNEEHQHH